MKRPSESEYKLKFFYSWGRRGCPGGEGGGGEGGMWVEPEGGEGGASITIPEFSREIVTIFQG